MLRWRPTFISQSPDIHQLGCSSEPSFGVSNWADIWTPITELQIHGDLISDDCGVVWSLAHARGSSVDQCQWKGLSYHGIFNKDMSNQSDMFGRQSVTAFLHLSWIDWIQHSILGGSLWDPVAFKWWISLHTTVWYPHAKQILTLERATKQTLRCSAFASFHVCQGC